MTVQISKAHHYGILTLDKPKALNALDIEMVTIIADTLKLWVNDKTIEAVIIRTDNPKSFCAGGDVKSVYYDIDAMRKGESEGDLFADFFFQEYCMNYLISTFPKPIISLIDGICMGGGVGLSIHGSHRIVSDESVIAMPETAIGLFPDVGVSHIFSKAPNHVGLFLGLTGYRMDACDSLYAGFATHIGSSDQIERFFHAIKRGEDYKDLLSDFSTEAQESTLKNHMSDIKDAMTPDTFEALYNNLPQTSFGQQIKSDISAMSPLSMAVTFEHYYKAKSMSIEDILTMDYRLSQGCMVFGDFYEGIRALLIDKDKNPKWNPASVELLEKEMVNKFFETEPKKGDLTFL